MPRCLFLLLLSLMLLCRPATVSGKVDPGKYGVTLGVDSARLTQLGRLGADSILRNHPQLKTQTVYYNIARPHAVLDRTADFYLLLLLCLLLGLIRFSDPRYFQLLLRAFQNPSGNRQFKEQIQSATLSNFLMNLFFGVVTGAYIFYVARLFSSRLSSAFDGPLLLVWLILAMIGIYLAKYLVIRFSGWAFRVETITEQYLFNVFLINKVIGIAMLPFVVLIAFVGREYATPLVVVSFILAALLLLNRYTRSWHVFGSFFQYSRFHFFTYLCASEILPMAILVKLILHTLL